MTKPTSKYGNLIQNARQPKNQQAIEPEDQINADTPAIDKPEDQIEITTEDQTYSQKTVQLTIEPENQINLQLKNNLDQPLVKTDNQTTSEPVNQIVISEVLTVERDVNLCCKIPESLRRHWAAESKRSGVTMTDVIVDAFTAKFGLPENWEARKPDK
jgi:hypothetical protein